MDTEQLKHAQWYFSGADSLIRTPIHFKTMGNISPQLLFFVNRAFIKACNFIFKACTILTLSGSFLVLLYHDKKMHTPNKIVEA